MIVKYYLCDEFGELFMNDPFFSVKEMKMWFRTAKKSGVFYYVNLTDEEFLCNNDFRYKVKRMIIL